MALDMKGLQYRVGAFDAGFRRVMGGVQRTLRSTHDTVQRGASTIRNWGLAWTAAGTAVGYAAKRIVDSTTQTATAIETVSKQTGVAVESLQGLHHAAKQAGVEIGTVDSSLRSFARRSAAAARGNEQYVKSFERLGLTQEDVAEGLHDIDELLLEVADRIAALPTEAERAGVAMDVMGDAGRRLVPLLSEGREGIEEFMEEARRLGIVLDREAIEKFSRYDATITRFRAGMQGLRMQLATAVVPIFERLARVAAENVGGIVEWVQENRVLLTQLVVLGTAFATVATGLGVVGTGIFLAIRMIGLLTGAIAFLLSPIGLLILASGALLVAWERDWLGIRGATRRAINFILRQWDRLTQWWEDSDTGKALRDWWGRVVKVWRDENLTLPEKTVEIAKLIPGVGWLVGFIRDVKGIWNDNELSFGEKVVAIAKLIPGSKWLAGFVADVKKIWADEGLTLPEKTVEILRLIPGVKAVEDMIAEIKKLWSDEELTLGEKAVKTLKIIADGVSFEFGVAVTAAYLLVRLAAALAGITGVTAAVAGESMLRLGITGAVLLLAFGVLRVLFDEDAKVEWEEDPVAYIEKVWRSDLGKAARLTVAITLGVRWLLPVLQSPLWGISNALAQMGGLAALIGRGLLRGVPVIRWALTLAFLLDLAWDLLPDEWKETTKKFFKEFMEERLPDVVRGALAAAGAATLGAVSGAAVWPITIAAVLAFTVNLIDWDFVGAKISSLWAKFSDWYRGKAEQHGWEPGEEGIIRFGVRLLLDVLGIRWGRGEGSEFPRLERQRERIEDAIATLRTEGLGDDDPVMENLLEALDEVEDKLRGVKDAGDDAGMSLQELGRSHVHGPGGPSIIADEERDLLARLVQAEAGIDGFEGMLAAAAVVLNRVASEEFPSSIRDVIEQTNAFESVLNGSVDTIEATEDAFRAVAVALAGIDPTKGSTFFWNPRIATDESGWFGRAVQSGALDFRASIGRHDFYRGAADVGLSWAEGLRSSQPAAKSVAELLAQTVADYTVGQSPPKIGPLAEIDGGGRRVAQSWLDGIRAEIEAQGGGLEATIKVVSDRMYNALIGVLEERWPGAAEFLAGLFDDDSEFALALDDLHERIKRLGDRFDDLASDAHRWTDNLVRGLSDAIAYGRSLTDVFDNFLRMLASRFIETQILGPLLNMFMPGLLGGLPMFHAGGLVLGGHQVAVMHSGGMVRGLRGDEVPSILQVGERVLSRSQNDKFERMLEERDGEGEPQEVNVNLLVQAVDASSFVDLARRNPEAITTVVLHDILRNGDVRQAIRNVSRGG